MISRPPDTQSINVALGRDIEAPTYADLSDAELDRLIFKCRRAIASHRQDSLSNNVETAETALVAIDGVKTTLRQVLDVSPAEKRATIISLLKHG